MNALTAILLLLMAPVILGVVYGLLLRLGYDPFDIGGATHE